MSPNLWCHMTGHESSEQLPLQAMTAEAEIKVKMEDKVRHGQAA